VHFALTSTRPRSAQHSPAIDRGRRGRAEAPTGPRKSASRKLGENAEMPKRLEGDFD
jgi:hypothetical protein